MILKDACCVVTGAARGIGFEMARVLLDRGARVVLSDVDQLGLEKAVAVLSSSLAMSVRADVANLTEMNDLAVAAVRFGGELALWVNNAGLARHRPVCEYSEAEIELMLNVNLKGTILGSQAALRSMAPKKRGHIVNVISTASLRGIPYETVYCAAKWGVRGFTQGLREEAAVHGVKVSALLPGGVDTAFWTDAVDRKLPVEDFLTPRQVANALVSLVEMDDSVVPQELVIRAIRDRDFSHFES